MTDPTIEREATELLTELDQHRATPRPWILPALVVLALLTCVAASILRTGLPQRQFGPVSTSPANAPRLLSLPNTSAGAAAFLLVQPGLADRDDIFHCTAVLSDTCANLTNSPAFSEAWPVLDPAGRQIAYFGLGDSDAEVFLRTLPTSTTVPLTVLAGDSGLHTDFKVASILAPAFAPDGMWIAFPARAVKGDSVELFLAQADGQKVLRATTLQYRLCDYAWLDNQTLTFLVRLPNGSLQKGQVVLQGDQVQQEMSP